MLILALDAATRTGFCCGRAGEKPRADFVRLRRPGEDLEVAFKNTCCFLRDLFVLERPDLIIFEAPLAPVAHRSHEAALLGIGVYAAAAGIAGVYGIRFEKANASTVSKFFTGKGKWSQGEGGRREKKKATIKRAQALGLLPPHSTDADMADAIALWCFASERYARKAVGNFNLFQAA